MGADPPLPTSPNRVLGFKVWGISFWQLNRIREQQGYGGGGGASLQGGAPGAPSAPHPVGGVLSLGKHRPINSIGKVLPEGAVKATPACRGQQFLHSPCPCSIPHRHGLGTPQPCFFAGGSAPFCRSMELQPQHQKGGQKHAIPPSCSVADQGPCSGCCREGGTQRL